MSFRLALLLDPAHGLADRVVDGFVGHRALGAHDGSKAKDAGYRQRDGHDRGR